MGRFWLSNVQVPPVEEERAVRECGVIHERAHPGGAVCCGINPSRPLAGVGALLGCLDARWGGAERRNLSKSGRKLSSFLPPNRPRTEANRGGFESRDHGYVFTRNSCQRFTCLVTSLTMDSTRSASSTVAQTGLANIPTGGARGAGASSGPDAYERLVPDPASQAQICEQSRVVSDTSAVVSTGYIPSGAAD